MAYLPEERVGKQNELPEAIEGVGIDEQLDGNLPGDVQVVDEKGNSVPIGQYFNQGKPIIFSPVYYSCPSLCNLHLKGVFEVLKLMKLVPGKDYILLPISFDPKEGVPLSS